MALPRYIVNGHEVKETDRVIVPQEPTLAFQVLDKRCHELLTGYLTMKQFRWLAETGVTFNQKAVLGAAGVFLDTLHPIEEKKMSRIIEETFGYKRHATTTEWRAISALLYAGMIKKGEKGYINTYRSR